MNQTILNEILEQHKKWLMTRFSDEPEGKRANLSEADLSEADLSGIKKDVFEILSTAPNEAQGVLDALKEGRVDGSAYTGHCACLVGTIANVRGVDVDDLEQDSDRPAERWLMGIKEGDTPETNPVSAIAAEWVQEWIEQNLAKAEAK